MEKRRAFIPENTRDGKRYYHLTPCKNEKSIIGNGLKARADNVNLKYNGSKAVYVVEGEPEFGLDIAFELLREKCISVFEVNTFNYSLLEDVECASLGVEPIAFLILSDICKQDIKLVGHFINVRKKSFKFEPRIEK